ncbi:hypothetical protein KA005_40930, partial [bacterium]|nr:hypothetical protein [bacterium]
MKTIGLDVETSKSPYLHPWQDEAFLVAVGIVNEAGVTKTWVFNHSEVEPRDQRVMIREIQEEISKADRIVGHNLKFDLNWMRKIGIVFDDCKLFCTQVAEFIITGQQIGKLSLDDLSKKYLDVNKIDRVKPFWEAGWETSDIPINILLPYLEQDCINTLAIFQRQTPIIIEQEQENLIRIEMESTHILSAIECNGMKFNVVVAQAAADDMRAKLDKMDFDLRDAFDFDIRLGSKQELSAALFGGIIKRDGKEYFPRKLKAYLTAKEMCPLEYKSRKCVVETQLSGMGFVPGKGSQLKSKGYFSVDKTNIAQLVGKNKKQKLVKKLLTERSSLAQALSSLAGKNEDDDKGLIRKVQGDGRIHSQYNQTVAKTGRLSSKDPNGQNLPREGTSPIKEAIEPEFDFILAGDLSQVEWRAAAFMSQDPVMLAEIAAGVDPHRENAITVFEADPADEGSKKFKEIRTVAKIVTFRLLYGGSAFGFWIDSKMPNYSKKRWEAIVEKFYSKYRGLKAWQDTNISTVYKNGGWMVNPTGRIFWFSKDTKGYDIRQIKNYPVQSLATADFMKLAMCIIYKKFIAAGYKSKIIAQVH